jgi:hypothetical protein
MGREEEALRADWAASGDSKFEEGGVIGTKEGGEDRGEDLTTTG